MKPLPPLLRCSLAGFALALSGASLGPSAVSAQVPQVPVDNPRIRAALDSIQRWQAWTLEQQVQLTEIEAPPFGEQTRAEEFRRRLTALGFQNVRIDSEGHVIAERPGSGTGPVVVVSGHLDTVFPKGTDVRVRREGNRLMAPGIGDDGRGLAVVLTVARAFQQLQIPTTGTILFVGTVGEEGQGDLRGVRHLFTRELAGRVDYFISVDGSGSNVTSAAVGSNRYTVTFEGPGGHSYGAFGMPNPAHALGRAVAAIADLQVPTSPKTTFSVSVLSGGTSVNSIPADVAFEIDMRSEQPGPLAELDARVRSAIAAAVAAEKARWPRSTVPLAARIDTIGIRPAGAQPDSAPIVQVALAASRALGLTSTTGASSTDANIPISMGIPAIEMDGGGRGGASHAPEEWYEDTADSYKGPQWAALIVAALAGIRPASF
jgi:acetylornithine deacetylase/succinyl-diaminopimelate desuccinylase-like protein